MSFDQGQQKYFLQELNRAVPTRNASSLDESAITLALGSTSSYLSEFNAKTSAIARDAECRGVPYPGSAMRAPDARTGCGWWFSPNATVPSTAAYGSRRGPMDPNLDTQIGAGQWVWDTEEAYMLEGVKAAASVQSCPDLQYSRFPNLGWCTTTNRAVLTDGNGNPAFPQVAGGDCPGPNSIVMNAASCPPPPPSSSGSTLSGANGPAALCTPNSSGALSPSCLQTLTNSICSSNGFLSQTLGNGYANSSSDFQLRNKYLTDRGFQLSSGILNDGVVSADAVISNVAGLKAVANAGDGSRAASAALNFCYGTPFDPCVYNPTDAGPFDSACITQVATAMGYGQAGKLMPANGGMSYWNNPFFATWGTVVDMLVGWKGVADIGPTGPLVGPTTVGPATQANAIANVYGVTVKQPKLGCNTTGISMHRYLAGTWFDPANLYPVAGANSAYLGRYLFKTNATGGFPFTAASMSSMTPAGSFPQESQRMSTVFIPTVGGSYSFLIICNSGGRFTFNNEPPVTLQGFNTPNPIFPQNGQLIAGQSYPIVIDLWNNVLPWSFAMTMSVDMQTAAPIPPSMLYLPQDRRLPIFELAFNKLPTSTVIGPIQDTYGLFQNLQLVNTSIGQLNGKQCMIVTGPGSGVFNRANYIQGVRIRAFKTLTMMMQLNGMTVPNTTTPSIIGFYNLPDTNTNAYPRKGLGPVPYTYGQRTADFILTSNNQSIYPFGIQPGRAFSSFDAIVGLPGYGATIQEGQWFHLALVWDDDGTGYTLYMNGTPGSHLSGFSPYDVTQIMENMCIGCDTHPEGQSWTGGFAWFRAFDYRLSPSDVTLDMNDNWASIV